MRHTDNQVCSISRSPGNYQQQGEENDELRQEASEMTLDDPDRYPEMDVSSLGRVRWWEVVRDEGLPTLRLGTKFSCAVMSLLMSFVAVFWIGALVVTSVQFDGGGDGGAASQENAKDAVLAAVCATVGISGLVWFSRRQQGAAALSRPGLRCAASFAVFGAVLIGCALMQTVLPEGDAPSERWGLAMVWTLCAGFMEEPVFSVLPTLIASRFRRPMHVLVPLIAMSAVLRGAMHLYQGVWPAALAVGWGAVAAGTYAAVGSLSGLIAAHVLNNVIVIAFNVVDSWLWIGLWAVVVATAAAWTVHKRRELLDAIRPRLATNFEVSIMKPNVSR
ncbi:MAG: hypothetical protein C0482_16185 [Gordonia sp.]|nr:hypothetical protein [Gordonia sp. (in: high G+C Gram-positive bacteria)]